MTELNEEKILHIIQDALQTQGKITLNTTSDDIEEWDSLGHLGILAALDTFFDGKVGDIKEIGSARSVREIVQILRDNNLF